MQKPTHISRDHDLLSLVENNVASTRLRNSIFLASYTNSLPFTTIGAYIDAGDNAESIMMKKMKNFGRKTSEELNKLVLEWLEFENHMPATTETGSTKENPSTSPADIGNLAEMRMEIISLFNNQTVADATTGEVLSVRLEKVIKLAIPESTSFASIIENFQQTSAQLLHTHNCGRKSVKEFQDFCQRYISAQLQDKGYLDATKLAVWLLGGPEPNSNIATSSVLADTKSFEKFPNQLATPKHDNLADRLEWLIAKLDTREQMILRRRNGIGQQNIETLQEIGTSASVSRERIRQIELNSFKKIRVWLHRAPITELLNAEARAAWLSLAGSEASLRKEEMYAKLRELDPYIRLALDILKLRIDDWLNQVAQPMKYGWLSPEADVKSIENAGMFIADALGGLLPKPLTLIAPTDMVSSAKIAASLIYNHPVVHNYLMPLRAGIRLTRLVRLHALLAGKELTSLEQLVQCYRTIFPDDQCSERDAEIVMDAAPHLFLETEDGCWLAIGSTDATLTDTMQIKASKPKRVDAPNTIARALQETLLRRGPTRLVDIIQDAVGILPDGRSAKSIGPILLTRRDLFVRVLPGVYALPEHVKYYSEEILPRWPILLNDTQACHYAISRHAGEPRDIFPFWTPAAEYSLCRWAHDCSSEAIFASLLAIATIEEWPIDGREQQEWFRLKKRRGCYYLGSSIRNETAYVLPELHRVFSACVYAVSRGQFNWVAGNRLTGRMIGSHGGAGLVAILLRLGAVEVIGHGGYSWQLPHRTTPFAAELCKRFDAAFSHLGSDANWTSAIGQELAQQAKNSSGDDWVDDAAFANMFSQPRVNEPIEVDDDDQLVWLFAEQRRARDAERRGTTVDWLIEE